MPNRYPLRRRALDRRATSRPGTRPARTTSHARCARWSATAGGVARHFARGRRVWKPWPKVANSSSQSPSTGACLGNRSNRLVVRTLWTRPRRSRVRRSGCCRNPRRGGTARAWWSTPPTARQDPVSCMRGWRSVWPPGPQDPPALCAASTQSHGSRPMVGIREVRRCRRTCGLSAPSRQRTISGAGGRYPNAACGRTPLSSVRHCSITTLASLTVSNIPPSRRFGLRSRRTRSPTGRPARCRRPRSRPPRSRLEARAASPTAGRARAAGIPTSVAP